MSAIGRRSGLGQSAAAQRLRPARRRRGARPVRPHRRRPGRQPPGRARTCTPPAPTSSPSPRSRKRSGATSGPTTPRSGSTARSADAPTSWTSTRPHPPRAPRPCGARRRTRTSDQSLAP
jgi:hypothetical protein